jgi:hypothetical protein
LRRALGFGLWALKRRTDGRRERERTGFEVLAIALCSLTFLGAEAPADSPARRILLEIHSAIRENSLRPPATPPGGAGAPKEPRLEGDALADSLVRTGLRAARREIDRGTPPRESARAVLVALGISLDPSGILQRNGAARRVIGTVESPEEELARSRALPAPSLRGRVDSLQHFAVSAAITAALGKEAAWAIGIEKEASDAAGKDRGHGSGFSFADLAADRSGLAFASRVLAAAGEKEKLQALLERLASDFRGSDFVPDLEPLARDPAEGLGSKAFAERFGSLVDPRFLEKIRQVDREVEGCPGFRDSVIPEPPSPAPPRSPGTPRR